MRLAPFLTVCLFVLACPVADLAFAQADPRMSFFATSQGNGANGGNYGGLAGADARCQSFAVAAGVDGDWRAYLSTAPIDGFGGQLVHARDRIGAGPWYNYAGVEVAADVAELHTAGIPPAEILTELGGLVPSTEHDMMTGSDELGFAKTEFPGNPFAPAPTCFNWTDGSPNAWGWVGHSDHNAPNDYWNSTHETPCDEAGMTPYLGAARLYCFDATPAPEPGVAWLGASAIATVAALGRRKRLLD